MANVTLKDIAEATGYSFSLVSRVLRKKNIESIPQKTIDIIRDTARDLGYIVNRNAQSLKMNKTNIIAVVMPIGGNFATTIFPMITESIVKAQYEENCEMDFVFFNTLGGYKEYENLQEIISLNPEGIIYSVPPKGAIGLSKDIERRSLLNDLAEKGKAIIFLMEKYDIPGTCTYLFDDFGGTYLGAKFLIEKGCKNILYCHSAFDSRNNGFLKAMDDMGSELKFSVSDEFVGFTLQDGYSLFYKLYAANKKEDLPDAIFATSDNCAMGIVKAMRELGFKDNDICIMGFDNTDITEVCDYNFYSVVQPVSKMSRDCTKAIIDWIETGNASESRVYKPEIVEHNPVSRKVN